jgi:hypothetical protein
MNRSLFLAIALLPALALANGKHPTKPPKPAPAPTTATTATSSADAVATSSAEQAQGQQQGQVQGQGQQQSANASNEGVSVSSTTTYQRQAPSTAQGSLMIGSCGAGGNAGGSNTRGSAFLGLAWTPADCKLLLAAAAYQAIGMNDAACEMINGISTVKARWKALKATPPSCAVTPATDLTQYVTKDQLAESQKRIIDRVSSK